MLLCLTFLSLAASGALSSATDQTVLAPGNHTDTLSVSIAKCNGELHWLALSDKIEDAQWIDLIPTTGDSSGCLYNVLNGWPKEGPAVAKTTAQPNDEYKNFKEEKAALERIQELYASGQDKWSKHWWLVMQKHDGMYLTDTSAYKENVGLGKSTKDCRAFVGAVHDVVATNVARYVMDYGVWHLDLHLSNILFDDRVTTAQLVDWGLWKSVPSNDKEEAQAAYNYGYKKAQDLVPLDTCP
ncbi:hypothetical protein B0H14DRAFT_3140418 [Mycena olivaceomarginata]|nr:hypothetical protein B0H14DRAFT_3140418 [Mycena olivaceomarginata]